MDNSTCRPKLNLKFEPSWPGLKVGAMLWMENTDSQRAEPKFLRWRSAWELSGASLQLFATAAIELDPSLRNSFFASSEALPLTMQGGAINQEPPKPRTRADAQAMAAIFCLFGPLFDRINALQVAALSMEPDESKARALATSSLQFPHAPQSEFDPGSGSNFRIGFCPQLAIDNKLNGCGVKKHFEMISAVMKPFGLTQECLLEDHTPLPETWSSMWAGRAWEMSCLHEWRDLWKRLEERKEIAEASSSSALARPRVRL